MKNGRPRKNDACPVCGGYRRWTSVKNPPAQVSSRAIYTLYCGKCKEYEYASASGEKVKFGTVRRITRPLPGF